jgi:hypothetical protein
MPAAHLVGAVDGSNVLVERFSSLLSGSQPAKGIIHGSKQE